MYTLRKDGVVVATQTNPIEYLPEQWAWKIDDMLICDTDKLMVVESTTKVPTSVSPRQVRQALTRAGLRTAVEAAVAVGDQDTKDWYEFATTFERNNQHVIDMGIALGVSEQALNELWILAGSL